MLHCSAAAWQLFSVKLRLKILLKDLVIITKVLTIADILKEVAILREEVAILQEEATILIRAEFIQALMAAGTQATSVLMAPDTLVIRALMA